jgi:hypothetical protein
MFHRLVVGVWVWFSSKFSASSTSDYLDSLAHIGCVAPRLLMHLSPRNDMIPNEGIMARPRG